MFKKIIHFFYRLFHRSTYTMSPSGDCLAHYIINKYINKTELNNYIDHYEQAIYNFEPHILEYDIFNSILDNETEANPGSYKEVLHYLAALYAFIVLIYATKDSDKVYLPLIQDEGLKEMIQYIKKKII